MNSKKVMNILNGWLLNKYTLNGTWLIPKNTMA